MVPHHEDLLFTMDETKKLSGINTTFMSASLANADSVGGQGYDD